MARFLPNGTINADKSYQRRLINQETRFVHKLALIPWDY